MNEPSEIPIPFPSEAPTGDELEALLIAASSAYADDVREFVCACLKSGKYTWREAWDFGRLLADQLAPMRPGGSYVGGGEPQDVIP